MKKKLLILSIIPLLLACNKQETSFISPARLYTRTEVNESRKIKNVILFIGDGMGNNQVNAASIYNGEPLVFGDKDGNDEWYHGYVTTDSLTSEGFTLDETKSLIRPDENKSLYDGTPSPYGNNPINGSITCYTDSAAAGTALATGVKTTNGRVGMDNRGKAIENLVEIASGLNKKTGVITTDSITGATPGSFLAHVGSRFEETKILDHASESNVDLAIGVKPGCWDSNYESLYKAKGYDNVTYDPYELSNEYNKQICLVDTIDPHGERTASLSDLVAYGIDYLSNNEGFFMMVEGACIDKQAHANQAGKMLEETLGFNEAVKTAMLWAKGREDTIIAVTADHETGAMYYDYDHSTQETIRDDIRFLSYNHSRSKVRIDVYGDISEYITKYSDKIEYLYDRPLWDNTYIFNMCCSYL